MAVAGSRTWKDTPAIRTRRIRNMAAACACPDARSWNARIGGSAGERAFWIGIIRTIDMHVAPTHSKRRREERGPCNCRHHFALRPSSSPTFHACSLPAGASAWLSVRVQSFAPLPQSCRLPFHREQPRAKPKMERHWTPSSVKCPTSYPASESQVVTRNFREAAFERACF